MDTQEFIGAPPSHLENQLTEGDEETEPLEQEVLEYAGYLGMNIETDSEFLYIAKEGLMAPVPPPWKACQSKDGEIYYYNYDTQQSSWDHPSDDVFRSKFIDAKEKKLGVSSQPLAEIIEE